jgi:spore germination cell wall hydrolase CwlJ-like protein
MDIPIPIVEMQQWEAIDILRSAIIGEAEGESVVGKMAVACVMMNRTKDKRWPGNYKDVCLQPKQFSCFEPKYQRSSMFKHDWSKDWWREAHFIAWGLLHGYFRDITRGANHYHAVGTIPYWAEDQEPVAAIGGHLFYKL